MQRIDSFLLLIFCTMLLNWGNDTLAGEPETADPEKPIVVRLLSYNIHHGAGMDGKLELKRIAKVIVDAKPDLVALQECDSKTTRTGNIDQPAMLAKWTGMHYIFGKNINFGGGGYGNAVLSRFPILHSQNHSLPQLIPGEQRGTLEIVVDLRDEKAKLLEGAKEVAASHQKVIPTLGKAQATEKKKGELKEATGLSDKLTELQADENSPTRVRFCATHFDYRKDDKERIASYKNIEDWLAQETRMPTLLVGDLNALPDSQVLKRFLKSWGRANKKPMLTFPADKPTRQIDYVLIRSLQKEKRWRVLSVQVLNEPIASDHRPLLVELEWQPVRNHRTGKKQKPLESATAP